MNAIPQTKRQQQLAAEREDLQTLLDDHPTKSQRKAAAERVTVIDFESKVEGYLAANALRPPK